MTEGPGRAADSSPRVSIVIPTYNRADLVRQAVASVIAQSWQDWELIVVDDGSNDETVAALEALGEQRLRVLAEPHCGHVARLRNIGAKAARGEYLAFLDADDVWLPQKLELQLRALAGRPGCWSYAAHELINSEGRRTPLRAGRFEAVSGRITSELLMGATGATVITWLVPRILFENLGGFDENLSLREDFDLALRLSESADAAPISDVLALVRDHGARKTRSAADQYLKTAIVYQRAAKRANDRSIRRVARREGARLLARAGEARLAAGRFGSGVTLLLRGLAGGAPAFTCSRSLAAGLWRWMRGGSATQPLSRQMTSGRRPSASPAPRGPSPARQQALSRSAGRGRKRS